MKNGRCEYEGQRQEYIQRQREVVRSRQEGQAELSEERVRSGSLSHTARVLKCVNVGPGRDLAGRFDLLVKTRVRLVQFSLPGWQGPKFRSGDHRD